MSIEAGGDLNIDGSFVMGKKVDVTVGGNMRIASRQNSYSYHAKNSAIGGGVSLKSGGVSLSKDQRDYSLRTVAEQAGIFAGKEGLTVTVKGKTTLVGAVIDSQGKKEKNQVTTGDLELKDMDNVASLSNKGGGVSYQTGQGTKVNEQGLTPMPVIGVDSKTKSKTYAAIVDGKLEITGNKKIKVEDINRNTQHTLNALENSLNLRKLEERKRLSTLFAKHANEAIHVISEKNKWKEGSPEKVLLHAFVGGMTAQMGGDTVLAGAIPGAVNEIFSGALQRYEAKHGPISPDQRQWLALVGGVITNYATGQTLQTGGAVAAYGTKWNTFKEKADWKNLNEADAEMSKAANEELEDTKNSQLNKYLTNVMDQGGAVMANNILASISCWASDELGKSNKEYESAVLLYNHAIDGRGENLTFDKNSTIAKDLIKSQKFRLRIEQESEGLSAGSSKIITFSENINDSTAQNVAFGNVKFAVEIRKDKDSHVFVTGKAKDTYDFSWIPYLETRLYSKRIGIEIANDIAYYLQSVRKLSPYIWEAEIDYNF